MAGQNQFYPFGTGPGANVLTSTSYAALAARSNGFVAGTAPSQQCNTAWRQSSEWAAVLGQFVADYDLDALDDGNLSVLQDNFEAALAKAAFATIGGTAAIHIGQDTGTTNSIIANVTPDISSYQFLSFYLIRVQFTNTGATIANFDNKGALPLKRRDGSDLQAGDIISGTVVAIVFDGILFRLVDLAQAEVPRIVPNPILYVRPDGNDFNSGLANTSAGALQTVSAAITRFNRYFTVGTGLTIQLGATGTYPLPDTLPTFAGRITIQGDTAARDSYILQGSNNGGAAMIEASSGMQIRLRGVRVNNPSTVRHTLAATGGALIETDSVTLASASAISASHIYNVSSTVNIFNAVTIIGSADSAMTCRGGNIAVSTFAAFTIVGTPSFGMGFAVCFDIGLTSIRSGATFTGAATGPRFYVDGYSVIRVFGNGVNYLPGSTAGTQTSTGTYSP